MGALAGRRSTTLDLVNGSGRNGNASGADVTYVGYLLGHGGDALQMLELARGMLARGTTVKIVLPAVDTSVTFKARCDELGIPCERSGLFSVTMQGARQSLPSAIHLLRAIQSPVVHFHTGNSCLPRNLMAGLGMLRYRSAFVTLQSPYETIQPGSARARFWAVAARHQLAGVVSPSDHGTAFQVRCGIPTDLAVTVRNSIDLDGMTRGDPRGPRASLGIGDDPLVLFCSRIDSQKRPAEAVRIFAGVAAEFPRARLVFVGTGEEEPVVRRIAAELGVADRVHLVGYQTNVASWLAAATVWLLPTERENFSVALLEALAAGCPVLSTTCQGNDEVLVDGDNAVTFAVGDVGAATAGLRHLLADPTLRARLGTRARRTARQFTAANMVERYRVLYRRAASVPASLAS
jgi:glycosyltransferase involved in cell wall biosynthesis